MTFRTERCPVGDAIVTLVSDFEGAVTMVICPDYDYVHGACARRPLGGRTAPLTAYLDRVSTRAGQPAPVPCIYAPATAAA